MTRTTVNTTGNQIVYSGSSPTTAPAFAPTYNGVLAAIDAMTGDLYSTRPLARRAILIGDSTIGLGNYNNNFLQGAANDGFVVSNGIATLSAALRELALRFVCCEAITN